MSKDFEPCPFCGARLELAGELVKVMRHPARSMGEAACPASGVSLEVSPEPDDAKIAKWNHRASVPTNTVGDEVSLVDAQPPKALIPKLQEYVDARLAVRESRKQTYLAAEERVRAAYAALRDEFLALASVPTNTVGGEPIAWCDDTELRNLRAGRMATVYGVKRADEEHHENPLYVSPQHMSELDPKVTATLRDWFNALPCDGIGKEHFDSLIAIVAPSTPTRDSAEGRVREALKVFADWRRPASELPDSAFRDKAPRDVKRLAAILNAPTYVSRAWTGRK